MEKLKLKKPKYFIQRPKLKFYFYYDRGMIDIECSHFGIGIRDMNLFGETIYSIIRTKIFHILNFRFIIYLGKK